MRTEIPSSTVWFKRSKSMRSSGKCCLIVKCWPTICTRQMITTFLANTVRSWDCWFSRQFDLTNLDRRSSNMCTQRWVNNFWLHPFLTSNSPLLIQIQEHRSFSFFQARTHFLSWHNLLTRRRNMRRWKRFLWVKIRGPKLRRLSQRLASMASGFCSKIVICIRVGCQNLNKFASKWKQRQEASRVAAWRDSMAHSVCG